jgi:hypothetical protein
MDQKTLIGKLKQAQDLLAECVVITQGVKGKREASRRISSESVANKASLPSQILGLRDGGFFKQAKTPLETHAGLQSSYPCELDRVVVALIRLTRRHKLRKASKLKGRVRQIAYVW